MRAKNLLDSGLLTRLVAVGEVDPSCVRNPHDIDAIGSRLLGLHDQFADGNAAA
jgi:hypothetical protein